jgi:hypothetical protein
MNQYKMDVFKVDVERHNNIVDIEISNVISWQLMKIKATKEEIKGLVAFLNNFIIDEEK